MKDWYLINNSSPSLLGGFENTYHEDFKSVAFAESLETDIASSVVLYNYDLSKSTPIRCIIQGNSADTQLKSMERIGLFVKGTVKAGMYIYFENRYWLITGYPSFNGIYEKATMQLCQYKLRWQNEKGRIIERWCNLSSASKYDTGESGNARIVLSTDNLTLLLPDDNESLDLDGKRVFIDKRKYNPTKVYKVTRTDSVLFDFGEEHGGVLSFIADKTELNESTDRPDLRLCNYVEYKKIKDNTHIQENPNESVTLNAKIKFNGDKELKIGGSIKTLNGIFVDTEGNKSNTTGVWDVITIDELIPYIKYTIEDNILRIRILDTSFSNSKVRVVFSSKDKLVSTYVDFDVVNMF